jgi:hypothetical protein
MDRKKIRKALDHFENDQFVDAKDIIKKEIAGKRDDFIKNKLSLSKDINPANDDKTTNDEGDE